VHEVGVEPLSEEEVAIFTETLKRLAGVQEIDGD